MPGGKGSLFHRIWRSIKDGSFCKKLYGRGITMLSRVMYAVRWRKAPVRADKIVFENYKGKGFGCNPKYIALELLRQYPGRFDMVWLVSRKEMAQSDLPPGIRAVSYDSPRAVWEHATAKVWLSNYHKVFFVRQGLRKRAGQFFVQTWHGSLGIKKLENDVPLLVGDKKWLALAKASSRMTDYWLSNSTFLSEKYKSAFWDVKDESILLYGNARDDLFFDREGMQAARRRVTERFGVAKECRIVLYVPTFREDGRLDCYQLDFEAVREHLQRRFQGEWAVLIRMHPRVGDGWKRKLAGAEQVLDATFYPDIQELLAASDCVISDYSGCIFDYLLTRRPAFLFTTDLDAYVAERGFYYPLESTPFPIARDNGEMIRNIDDFDEGKYLERVEDFLQEKGCMDDGHASERAARLIARLAAGNGDAAP